MYVCMCTYDGTSVHICECTSAHICVFECVCFADMTRFSPLMLLVIPDMNVCLYVCMNVCVHVIVHQYTYVYVHVCVLLI